MKFTGILFDLDGTLIDSNELIFKSFEYTFEQVLQQRIPREIIARTFGKPLVEVMPEFSADKTDLLLQVFAEYNQQHHDAEVQIFPHVGETMAALKQLGLKIAVVTSKKRFSAERGLTNFGLEQYVDEVITPESTVMHKPHPEPALRAMELLSLHPEQTIMVGDSSYDILCGRRAGCRTALVSYSVVDMAELMTYQPDYILHTLQDLLPIVQVE